MILFGGAQPADVLELLALVLVLRHGPGQVGRRRMGVYHRLVIGPGKLRGRTVVRAHVVLVDAHSVVRRCGEQGSVVLRDHGRVRIG